MRELRLSLGSQRAQTLLEFALIMPVAFVLLFGIIDFGVALDHRITVQHAVREGARYGAVTADVDAIKDRTAAQARGLIDADDVEVCYQPGPDSGGTLGLPGDLVRVKASYSYDLAIIGGGLSLIGGGSIGPIDWSPYGSARLETKVPGAVECP